jgi:hypothetical protein
MVLLFCQLLSGCRPALSKDEWVREFTVTDARWQPLPEVLELPANGFTGLTFAFRPGQPSASILEGRTVFDPEEWELRADLYDEQGIIYLRLLGGGERWVHDLETLGVMRQSSVLGSSGLESVVWRSPGPPANPETGMLYRWTQLEAPAKPGNYELRITLHPTALSPREARFPARLGPAIDLGQHAVRVIDGPPRPAGLTWELRKLEGTPQQREWMLRAEGIPLQ